VKRRIEFFEILTDMELHGCRIRWDSKIYRLFCFIDRNDEVEIANGFAKKTQKTPHREIDKLRNIEEITWTGGSDE
jgi:phage-related protein